MHRNLKPVWKPFEINVADVGGYDNPIRIQVFDHERSGEHNRVFFFFFGDIYIFSYIFWYDNFFSLVIRNCIKNSFLVLVQPFYVVEKKKYYF